MGWKEVSVEGLRDSAPLMDRNTVESVDNTM